MLCISEAETDFAVLLERRPFILAMRDTMTVGWSVQVIGLAVQAMDAVTIRAVVVIHFYGPARPLLNFLYCSNRYFDKSSIDIHKT